MSAGDIFDISGFDIFIEIFQASDTYFLESGDKIRYFFEVFYFLVKKKLKKNIYFCERGLDSLCLDCSIRRGRGAADGQARQPQQDRARPSLHQPRLQVIRHKRQTEIKMLKQENLLLSEGPADLSVSGPERSCHSAGDVHLQEPRDR